MAKEVHKQINLWLNSQGIENNLKSVRQAITKTANELAKLPIGSEEWVKKSEKLKKLKDIYGELNSEIKETSKTLKEHNKKLNDTVVAAGAISAVYATASSAVHRFVATTQEYVEAYARMDDAMTNVSKYTGLTREEVKQLNEEFRKMDTRTPTEKLNALAADAGRLGITSKEAIKDFVEAADIINVALGEDLGEDAVKEIGKLAEMFGTTNTMGLRGAMLATGSAINTLAQSSSASERYLMDFTSRLSGAANQAKMTQAEVLGFASVLDQNKQQVEMSATAMQKLMMDMFTEPAKYAKLAGMSVKDFSDLLKNDANEALLTFFETLNRKGGLSDLAPIFDKLGLDGARASGVISVLAQNIDDVRKEQELANTAFQEGTSVINEAAAVNGNAAAQLEKAKKKMQDMKAELGKELIPILTQLYETLNKGAGWIKEHIILVKTIAIALGLWITTITAYKALQITANALLAITNGLHKAHRIALIASAAAQALFNKNLTRAQAATVLMKRELPSLTAAFRTLKSSLSTIGNVFLRIVRLGPVAFIGAVAGAVIKANREANEGKRIIKQLDEQAHETLTRSMADIEVEKLKIKQLRSIIHDETAAREEKLKSIKDIQAIVPGYVAELSEEGRVVRENTTAINDYIEAVSRSLQSDVIKEELRELYKQIREKQAEVRKEKALYDSTKLWDQIRAAWKGQWDFKGSNKERALYDLVEKATKLEEELKAIQRTSVKEKAVEKEEDDCTGDPETCQCEYHKQLRKDAQETAKKEAEEKRKELIRQRKDFQKKLKKMREDEQDESLNEWEKVKTEIIRKYAEIEEEAAKLYGKNSEMVKNVQEQKTDAIALAGQKYLKTTKDFVTKFSTEINQMLAETQGNTGAPQSRLVAAIAGSDKEWDKAITEAKKYAERLADILFDMDEEDPLWNNFATELAALQDQIEDADLKKAEARIAITKKFVEEETKGLQQREKEQQRQIALNKQGITEEQKAALQRQWKIDDMREEYDVEIKLMETALKAAKETNAADAEGIENIEKMIEKLKKLRDNVESTVDAGTNTKKTGNALIDLMTGALTNPQERFRAVIDVMQDFANRAADIYQQIADAQQKSAELDMERFNEAQDAKARKLQQQLDEGLISQKYYDAQMEKMEAEKEQREKKMKHEQFERERESAIVQALIQGGLAVARGFAEWGWPGGLIVGTLTTAETAAQVALIASQVNPYAKGGYIRKKQIALVGEEGQEWVASNSLLEDKETAPVIAALDDYQRGNRNAMRLMAPTQPAWKNLSQSASQISSTFASNRTPVEHHYYHSASNDELLKEVKQMNQFLADPKNRQAYISYKIQTEAQKNRDFIKQAAKL